MGANTRIEWAHDTFNPVIGCTKISAGCDHCYAEAFARRFGITNWGPDGVRQRTSAANWSKPRAWNRQAAAAGERRRVFCASLADVFDTRWPAGARRELWTLIAETPALDWLLLTKRPQNIERMLPADWNRDRGYRHVWLGISAESQAHYDVRWPVLAAVPAWLRFLSYEPALGPLEDLQPAGTPPPDWIIAGGESGAGARAPEPVWFRQLAFDCGRLRIPFFLKQWGRYKHNPLVTETGQDLEAARMIDPPSNGKGGALLDGWLHRGVPA